MKMEQWILEFIGIVNREEENRGSRITAHTHSTRLQHAFELKFAPLFAPLTNLLTQT